MPSSQAVEDLSAILRAMKSAHIAFGPADASLRKDRLQRAVLLIKENYQALSQAISDDFGHRSMYQSISSDIFSSIKMLENAASNVAEWMKPEQVKGLDGGIEAWIQQQPIGVVGIISPWNFPINLSFGPLAGIFSAGNTALLKPSELTPKTSELLAELIGRYFDPMELGVVLGDADTGKQFSQLPFDHLIFTGSTTVGKHVMRAAAENLVPVTLELGGKSPVVVAKDADISIVAERTMTIKTFNVGQICMSPDYIMLPDGALDCFVDASKQFIQHSFETMQNNPDYTAIINPHHYQRLIGLLEDAKQKGATIISLAPKGEKDFDEATRKIAPHLVLNVSDNMLIMQEEIFGPLLPIRTYSHENDPIDYINRNPRPLAAYYFGENPEHQDYFAANTTSGALVINDVMTHSSIEALPFGGIGASGIGAYHGIHGFRRFTHAKPVVVQSEDGASNLRLRAPYSDKQAMIEAILNQK